jgi:hypothetical protein
MVPILAITFYSCVEILFHVLLYLWVNVKGFLAFNRLEQQIIKINFCSSIYFYGIKVDHVSFFLRSLVMSLVNFEKEKRC